MIIGVHAVAATRSQPTGVEVYTREVLRALAKLPDASAHRFLLYTNTANGEWKVLRAPFLWTQVRLSWEMFRHAPSVLFVPAQALPRVLPRRTVVTVHGMEFDDVPHCYAKRTRAYLRWVTRDAVSRADSVIAVSEATKQGLIKRYGVSPEKVIVIHHGAPSPPRAEDPQPSTLPPARAYDSGRWRAGNLQPPYFLYVGRLELKKNIDGIVRGFTLFLERHPDSSHELVLAGGAGFGYSQIRAAIASSPRCDRIRILGYVGEKEKWTLLRGAEALLLPSWTEGFGMPILEAQVACVPVITGTTGAMPEVAGDGALFVPPGDDGAFAEALSAIADNSVLRVQFIKKGYANATRFYWEEAARKTMRVLLS